MGKKRTVKKRVKQRIQKKKDNKTNNNNSAKEQLLRAAGGNMSKLEYEQSMMDPRFKAAMMGFNQPQQMNPFANQARHDLETKNNELIRKLTHQHDMAVLNQQSSNLQQQYKTQAAQIKDEQQQQRTQRTINEYQQKLEREKAKHEQDAENNKKLDELKNDIRKLQNSIDDQNRERQAREKQENLEKKLKDAAAEGTKAALEEQYGPKIREMEANINEMKNKEDVAKTKFDKEQEVLSKQAQEEITKMETAANAAIRGLQERITNLKITNEAQQEWYNIVKTFKELSAELAQAKNKKEELEAIAPYKDQIAKLEAEIRGYQAAYAQQEKTIDAANKVNELLIKSEHLKQKTTEKGRQEAFEQGREGAAAVARQEKDNALMKQAMEESDKADSLALQYNKMGIKVLGNKFNPDNHEENAKLIQEKLIKIQKRKTEGEKQLEAMQRLLKNKQELEELKRKEQEANSKITTAEQNIQAIQNAEKTYAQERAALKQTEEILKTKQADIDAAHARVADQANKNSAMFNQWMEEDPAFAAAAWRVAEKKNAKAPTYDMLDEINAEHKVQLEGFSNVLIKVNNYDNLKSENEALKNKIQEVSTAAFRFQQETLEAQNRATAAIKAKQELQSELNQSHKVIYYYGKHAGPDVGLQVALEADLTDEEAAALEAQVKQSVEPTFID